MLVYFFLIWIFVLGVLCFIACLFVIARLFLNACGKVEGNVSPLFTYFGVCNGLSGQEGGAIGSPIPCRDG